MYQSYNDRIEKLYSMLKDNKIGTEVLDEIKGIMDEVEKDRLEIEKIGKLLQNTE